MKVLTIDLGVTTGWCVRELHGDLIALGEVEYSEDDMDELWRALVQRYLPSYVVIEAPVLIARGELQGKLARLIQSCRNVFKNNTEWVTPSQWKQRYGKTSLPDTGSTPSAHMKDAYRISEWWLKTR